jgi:limonene-1,2-epoxide hydrolase
VIARTWRGVVAAESRLTYAAYVEETGVAEYTRTPGCRFATVLSRDLVEDEARAEVIAFSVWDDEDAIRRFAGPDIEEMVLYPEDERHLLEPPTLTHHDVSFASAPAAPAEDPHDHAATALAFSTHRFEEVFDRLGPDATWHLVGEQRLAGRDAIVAACRATQAELAGTTTTWLRSVTTGGGDVVAVDTIARYADDDGAVTVSSCDVYEFDGDQVVAITSYAAELDDAPDQPS